MKTILHLCADIGSDSKPYKDAGYEVICIGKNIGVENYIPPPNNLDLRTKIYGVIANPVCTEFSTARSGGKARNPQEGFKMVKECLRIISRCNPTFWVIENPATGRLKDFLGKPDYVYQPWEFGSPWTKKTALWGKFNKPNKIYTKWEDVPKNNDLYIRGQTKHPRNTGRPAMYQLHKSAKKFIKEFDCFNVSDDMSFRSLCSQGFAQAFFEVNK